MARKFSKELTAEWLEEMRRDLKPGDTRAEWANEALLAFAGQSGQNLADEAPEVLGDLLADLRHWAARNDVDFDVCARNALAVYEEEKGGDPLE